MTSKRKPFYRQLTATGEIALSAMCPDCKSLKFDGKVRMVGKRWVDEVYARRSVPPGRFSSYGTTGYEDRVCSTCRPSPHPAGRAAG